MAARDCPSIHIIHCDLDAFFASVEQMDNPSLQAQPVIVGGTAGSRGVVSTCSYEARAFGVHSAMPMAQAHRLCPRGIFMPVRMSRYQEISQQVFAILSQYTPLMEPLSIDEAFLDVSGTEALFGSPERIGRQIKEQVKSELDLIISVGISYNKFLAKLASELGKPDGLRIITFDQALEVLKPLPVTRLWGVGDKGKQALHHLGLYTIGDIQTLPPGWLEERLGDSGRHYWELARGVDLRRVEVQQERKSLGREVTFSEDVSDMETLQNHLVFFAAELCSKLRKDNILCSTVTVKLRYRSFKTITRRRTIAPSHADLVIGEVADELLRQSYSGEPPLRLLGLSLGKLSKADAWEQGSLFQEERKNYDLDQLMDSIRQRFGLEAIQRGNLVKGKDFEK
ncbi:MAG TPA: DNA polymerase IV [Syntrophomonadaceae bacterium]|nr:DNA polymerase IV [Syntrophomonadaceae bacterium]